jgi:hypothetical protein
MGHSWKAESKWQQWQCGLPAHALHLCSGFGSLAYQEPLGSPSVPGP